MEDCWGDTNAGPVLENEVMAYKEEATEVLLLLVRDCLAGCGFFLGG